MKQDLSWLKTLRSRKLVTVPFDYKSYMIENNIDDLKFAELIHATSTGVYAMIKRGTLKKDYLKRLPNSDKYVIKH